ncbi:transcription factor CP2 and like protein [Exophiala viscosa]|uniref:transcription factor CP2 and like protein n=1 Tax=Exophiala viscosa TaxID=2486360 RepID=UPI00218EFC03|nr:transcription factor CP2 and like protein [Exophiala viscosa]
MFRNRRTTQKPHEELYAAFKQTFPEVGPGSSSSGVHGDDGTARRSSTLSEAIVDEPNTHIGYETQPDTKEQDATPKTFTDPWRFTPSLMDPNSFAFSAFANQPPGYYTPTPGGFGTLYHPQAGDLHTPGMGMNTPLSLPHSVHALHAQDPMMHLQHFNPHLMHQSHSFHDPFHQQAQLHVPPPQQQTFAPQAFLQHEDSGYVGIDDTPPKTTPQQQPDMSVQQPTMNQSVQPMTSNNGMTGLPMGEKFRFHTTLNAPTAMVRHSEEIPITYLNKGQAYTMSIWDTTPPMTHMPQNGPVQYRTYVRVSFEDEQQRARPGNCWQLWKEGRGSNEAHQRGGRLLAVEYVDPNQGGDDELRKSQIQLEKASFDGFAVTWYPNPVNGGPDCSVSVRFNFLSTDFSHSKGVKGIPVRLCAKTELVTPGTTVSNEPEVCFSKVKLFRDHGAERKLSNDVAHVKKTIDKLKQQIAQAEAGLGNAGKRRRSGSMAKPSGSRPGKVMKHKRTWSVDSDAEGTRFTAEEDLQLKLVTMQDMFSSTRPVSILFLRGDPEDDPDLCPVKLPGSDPDMKEIVRTSTWESRQSATDSPTSDAGSPRSSSASQTTPKRKYAQMQQPAIQEEGESEYENEPSRSVSAPRPIKILKTETEAASKSDLFAVDIDSSYQPPTEKSRRPVACFYVRQKDAVKEYYRAVYLMHRTVEDLISSISDKFSIDPLRVTQVTHVNSRGLHIIVDEDVVRELPEGQDMVVEFAPSQSDEAIKQQFVAPGATTVVVDGDFGPLDISALDPLEMWLNY